MASRERNDYMVAHNHLSFAFGDGVGSPFRSLSRRGDEIRLFRLEPGKFGDIPQGTFETFPVDTCPPFRAVSYEWFDDKPVHPVIVGASTIRVRFNLYMFLKNYQAYVNSHPIELPHYIWIDHVCIEQDNDTEKSHQVSLMHKLYRKAKAVIAWLGPDHDQHDHYKHHVCGDPHHPVPRCCAFTARSILNLSFWTRLWIQQEMFLARRVIFMVGSVMLTPSGILNCFGKDVPLIEQEPALKYAILSGIQRRDCLNLIDAIDLFCEKDCAQKKDKVYGLLGMVWPWQRIVVDYSLRRYELFEITVKKVFAHEMCPMDKEREVYVVDALMKLGRELGISHYDAFPLCEQEAESRNADYQLLEYKRRWSSSTEGSFRSSSPSFADDTHWERFMSHNTSSSSFSSSKTQIIGGTYAVHDDDEEEATA